MILMALFVALLVVIIIMQNNRISKLEVGQEMVEGAIDNLYEVVFPDEDDDNCDLCGEPLSFEQWLETLPPTPQPSKCPFKKGDKVKRKSDCYITTVVSVPGMKEYDSLNFLGAERGFKVNEGWDWFKDYELVTPKNTTKKAKKPLTKKKK